MEIERCREDCHGLSSLQAAVEQFFQIFEMIDECDRSMIFQFVCI